MTQYQEQADSPSKFIPNWVKPAMSYQQDIDEVKVIQDYPIQTHILKVFRKGLCSLVQRYGKHLRGVPYTCFECEVQIDENGRFINTIRCSECNRIKCANRLTKKYVRAFEILAKDERHRVRFLTLTLPGDHPTRDSGESAKPEMLKMLRYLKKKKVWNDTVEGFLWAYECTEKPHPIIKDKIVYNPHMHLITVGSKIDILELKHQVEKIGFGNPDIELLRDSKGIRYACKQAIFYGAKEHRTERSRGASGSVREASKVVNRLKEMAHRHVNPFHNNDVFNEHHWLWRNAE